MRVLRPARHGACHFCPGLLSPFHSGHTPRAIFSTRLLSDVSLKMPDIYKLPAAASISRQAPALGKIQLRLEPTHKRSANAHRRGERGEGRLKGILILVIIVFAIYSAVKIIPPYVSDYQLSDKMQEQARFAIVNRYTEEQIRDNVYKVVEELQIPAKREDIKVTANNSVVTISMEYTVPVDLLVYKAQLHFTPSSENKALL